MWARVARPGVPSPCILSLFGAMPLAGTSGRLAPTFRGLRSPSPLATLLHITLPGYDAAFMTTKPSTRPSNLREKSQLMSASEIERTLVRLVHEIIEKNNGAADLGLVGIRRRGVPIAQRLGQMIARIEKVPVPVGTLDITQYRDDLSPLAKPVVQKADI